MYKKLSIITLLIVLAFVQGCSVTNVREHPTLERQLLDVDSVLIVPAIVSIEQINFSDANERQPALEKRIKARLKTLATRELRVRGFEVVDFDIEKAISENDELAYAVNQAREGFDEAKKTLYETTLSEEDKRKFKVSVGTAVNIVAQQSGADAVLIMHYQGSTKSGGMIAKDIAVATLVTLLTGTTPIAATEQSIVEIAFIDGVTGEVLWSNIIGSPKINVSGAQLALDSFPSDVDSEAEILQIEKSRISQAKEAKEVEEVEEAELSL